MADTTTKGTSSTAAVAAIGQIAQGVYSGYLARSMESDRRHAGEASAQRANSLRASSNAATGAISNLQRYLQTQRTQRAVKNAEALHAQGQEAITALATSRTNTDFKLQIAGAQEQGASAARSAAAGVAGDSLPVEMAQTLATARQRASVREQAEREQDDLSIRSSRALAGGATGGDLSVLLPGLDRRFSSAPQGRWMPNAWETMLQGVTALPADQLTNLVQTAAPAVGQGVGFLQQQYSFRFGEKADDRFIAPDGTEDQ